MTFREFTGKNVEEAIRTAMKEYSADLSELDIEILSQGSRGILGVGGEEARILAAPKSAVAAAETVRDTAPERRSRWRPPVSHPARASAPGADRQPTSGEPMSEQIADLGRAEAPARAATQAADPAAVADDRTATRAAAAATAHSASDRRACLASRARTGRRASRPPSSRASRSTS